MPTADNNDDSTFRDAAAAVGLTLLWIMVGVLIGSMIQGLIPAGMEWAP